MILSSKSKADPDVPVEKGSKSGVRSKPIGYRIAFYFITFVIAIMLVLWLLQILFLQTFYQLMKINELYRTADVIETSYGKESLYDTISNMVLRSDVYIQIEHGSEVLYASSSNSPVDTIRNFAHSYDKEVIKSNLLQSTKEIVTKLHINANNSDAMIYASILDHGMMNDGFGKGKDYFSTNDGIITYLFIYTPLNPVGSTIDILAEMLIIITVISIVIGIIMSLVISKRLARPIGSITKSAARLAQKDYDVRFEGSGYAETEELAATLNFASEELSKADKLQRDLIANVSHDLKTPLTMVKSYAEMIRDISGDNPEKREKHLNVIIHEADRLNDLVNDLTILSKMQANVDALQCSETDLTKAAKDTIDSFLLHAEQDGFTFELETSGDTTVYCDEKKIRQVFANLIGNAVRYSSSDKYIKVTVDEKPDCVRCEVIDHGQGISSEDLESVWDRYYQSSQNHSRTSKGSGLGLSIVKQIFILHRARYGVESAVDEGSTFWFEILKNK